MFYVSKQGQPASSQLSINATPIVYLRVSSELQLSDDIAGGGTAFPKLGVASRPTKGSAVFWYNLKNDGSRDEMSLHGGCPTIHGIKWGWLEHIKCSIILRLYSLILFTSLRFSGQ